MGLFLLSVINQAPSSCKYAYSSIWYAGHVVYVGTEHRTSDLTIILYRTFLVNTQGQLKLDERGYVQLQHHTHTSVDGVFACGDVADSRYHDISSTSHDCSPLLTTLEGIDKQ
jgi:thioredoxin reductase